MSSANLISQIALDVIEPLCDGSKNMFLPCRIPEHDWIRIEFYSSEKTGLDTSRFRIKLFSLRKHWQTGQLVNGPHSHQTQRWLDRLPEKRQRGKWWVVPASDLFALLLNYHWSQDRMVFDSEEVENAYKFLLLRFLQQTAKVRARGNLDGWSFHDHPDFPLNRYQKEALKGSMDSDGYALFMEQGTGKTPIVIARIMNEALRSEDTYRVLIICPKNVRTNWVAELHKFATVPGTVTVVKGTELERVKCVAEGLKVKPGQRWAAVVCSYEAIVTTDFIFNAVPWDLAVADESHFVKEKSTKRWRKGLRPLRENCRQRMALTGTPVTNTPMDLYTQLEWLGPNGSGFSSFESFRNFFTTYVKNGANHGRPFERIYQFANVPMLQERLARSAYLIRKEVALPDLPKKMHDIHEVEMTKEQSRVYDKILSGLIAEIENDISDVPDGKRQVVVTHTLAKLLRLSQVTSGFVGMPDEFNELGEVVAPAGTHRFDPNPKVEALVEILAEKEPHQKTIVWSNYVQDIRTIAARLRLEGHKVVTYYGSTSDDERDAAVTAFNEDPTTTVFIGNPAAGGTGINLLGYDHRRHVGKVEGVRTIRRVIKDNDFVGSVNTYDSVKVEHTNPSDPPTYCDHVIYFAQNWSLPARAQSEDRAHRRGTVNHVRYTDLVVPDTIDEEIRTRVVEKRITATKIQDVRSIITKIMRV